MSDVEKQETKANYSIAEFADIVGLSQKIIRRYIASGEIKATKIGNSYKIPNESLISFKAERNNETQPVNYDLFGNIAKNKIIKKTPKLKPVSTTPIYDLWANPNETTITFVDCFCGAGGLSKGFELAGLKGICGLDFFKEAGETYSSNFNHPFILGDITQKEVKEHLYATIKRQLNGRRLNIIAGGFPCQGFSMAGNRIVEDPRNSLYKDLLEIVNHLKPDFVICENVKGIRSMLKGSVEQKIVDDFTSIGYKMDVCTLCAADYEVPQKRERVIFIGNRIGKTNLFPEPFLTPENYKTTEDAIGDLINWPEDIEFNHQPTKHSIEMQKRITECPEGESLYKGYSDAWKKCQWDKPSCTIKENHGGVNLHPKLPRVLTAREMARLQSFPDDFIFMGKKNKQLVQIGNAVPPLLGKAIGLSIIKSYDYK